MDDFTGNKCNRRKRLVIQSNRLNLVRRVDIHRRQIKTEEGLNLSGQLAPSIHNILIGVNISFSHEGASISESLL